MIREFWGGVRWALRRWPEVFGVSFLVAVASIVLALVLGETLHSADLLRGGVELRNREAVTFTPYYLENWVSSQSDDVVELAASHLGNGNAYTTINGDNIILDDTDFRYQGRILVVVGDAVRDIFPELGLCHPAPCVSAGYEIGSEPIPAFRYAGMEFNVEHTLAENTTFFDPDVAGLRLDNHIVVRLPVDNLVDVDEIGREEALSKLVLLQPEPVVVDRYVEAVAKGNLVLVPEDLAGEQPKRFDEIVALSASLMLAIGAFLALLFLTFTLSVMATMKRHRPAFFIRRAYGASTIDIAVRTFGFLAVTVLLIPVTGLLFLTKFGGPYSSGAPWVLVAVVAVFTGLWIAAIRQGVSNTYGGTN